MLFDLRARGRRRTIKVIYASLAILMGGGLVLFGIGGDVQGGLFDAVSGRDGDDGSSAIQERVDQADERVQANRQDPAAWAQLAQARYQLAGVGEGFDPETGQFTDEGRNRLRAASQAWSRHLELAGDEPDTQVAALMVNALSQLGQLDDAVRAQEIVVENREPAYGLYAQLAVLAYQAEQTRKGDLARRRAIELAPEDLRPTIREQLDSAKTQAVQQQLQQQAPQGGDAPPDGGAGELP
jgi:hypothetical protein